MRSEDLDEEFYMQYPSGFKINEKRKGRVYYANHSTA